jgi:diguanylate cyclase (GGDEF)-like protein/PAS domain S-box-containing protein
MIISNPYINPALEALIKITDDACVIYDLDQNKILVTNDQFLQLLNIDDKDHLPENFEFQKLLSRDPDDFRVADTGELDDYHKQVLYKTLQPKDSHQFVETQISINTIALKDINLAVLIIRDITKEQWLTKAQQSMVKISESVGKVEYLNDLLYELHQIISEVMPANNFYISLYSPEDDSLSFPYFVDEYDPPPLPQKSGRGLTEYILRKGQPLLVTPEVFDHLVEIGEVAEMGAPSIDWLGVPLIFDQKTIGVMATQTYTEGVRYTPDDLQFLFMVAPHVANAIKKKQSDEALRNQHDLINSIFDSSPNPIVVTDLVGTLNNCNQAALDLWGFTSKDDLVHRNVMDRIQSEDRSRLAKEIRELTRQGSVNRSEFRSLKSDGSVLFIETSSSLLYDEDHNPVMIITIINDVTQKYMTNKALRNSEERFKLAVMGSNDGIWDWDLESNHIYYSPRWKMILGYKEEEVDSDPNEWFDRIHPSDLPSVRSALEAHLSGQNSHFESEFRLMHKNGEYLWVLARGIAVSRGENEPCRIAGSLTDVTRNKHTEKQLAYEVLHDKLTGLPNRALFIDRLNQSIKRSKRHEHETFAILILDLDRFKVLNDSLGHLAGDKMLIKVAQRLESSLRMEDSVARLGGDEFAVLLNDMQDPFEVIQIANRIHEEISTPVNIDDQPVYSTASIGITLSSTGYDTADDMLRDADTAMYQAKGQGGNSYVIFDRFMHAQAVTLLHMETDLRQALENDQFEIYYQPIFDVYTNKVVNVEALIRWNHPQQGLIYPGQFITIAEDTGLIVPLGEWVLKGACSQLREWHEMGFPSLKVSVNFSARQFQQSDLTPRVARILDQSGIEPENLFIEITESRSYAQLEKFESMLWDLKRIGIKVSIDDFGTGYSSLSIVQRLPLDVLKIGQSFIANLGSQRENDLITQSIIEMAHRLGFTVIAEGVETDDQLRYLKKLQCDMIQGFLFSKPIRVGEVNTLLEKSCR